MTDMRAQNSRGTLRNATPAVTLFFVELSSELQAPLAPCVPVSAAGTIARSSGILTPSGQMRLGAPVGAFVLQR